MPRDRELQTNIGNGLTVTGLSTLSGITVPGASTLTVGTGATTLGGALDVTGEVRSRLTLEYVIAAVGWTGHLARGGDRQVSLKRFRKS